MVAGATLVFALGVEPVFAGHAFNLAEIYKAAKAEGKVVVYTAPKPPWYKFALQDFEKKFPAIARRRLPQSLYSWEASYL